MRENNTATVCVRVCVYVTCVMGVNQGIPMQVLLLFLLKTKSKRDKAYCNTGTAWIVHPISNRINYSAVLDSCINVGSDVKCNTKTVSAMFFFFT